MEAHRRRNLGSNGCLLELRDRNIDDVVLLPAFEDGNVLRVLGRGVGDIVVSAKRA
jgi:hypothetical protein